MSMFRTALVALLSFFCAAAAMAQGAPPDLVLHGSITGKQNQTYVEVPFTVPEGVHRLSVDFSYTGKEHKTTIDLGIADPERFRGNSGGNKSHFTIGESDATPSYLPGKIVPGTWKLMLSVPNIRAAETAEYRAEIRFNSKLEDSSFTMEPLATGTRWYRGDLHMHTAHSDGSCLSQSGKRVPCPVFLTAQTATQRGLDFIAITDHNTTSQYDAMRELQPYFDRLLLIPGREITTFWGHFNIFGITAPIDYRVVPGGRDVNAIVRDVRALGGIASINHPLAPHGEVCMGCGWVPRDAVDLKGFSGVEVINGGPHALNSSSFWDEQIATGAELTAIGGSDSHNALSQPEHGSIGQPVTVVEARELSVAGILEGIQHGRVFVDLTASHDRSVDMDATAAGGAPAQEAVRMGGTLAAPGGGPIHFRVLLKACEGSTVHIFVDGHESAALPALQAKGADETLNFDWKSDGGRHWVRVEVRDTKDALMLLSNPIYINFAGH